MESNELSQLSVIKAFASMKIHSKNDEDTLETVPVRPQVSTFESFNTNNNWNEPIHNPVQGRGRKRNISELQSGPGQFQYAENIWNEPYPSFIPGQRNEIRSHLVLNQFQENNIRLVNEPKQNLMQERKKENIENAQVFTQFQRNEFESNVKTRNPRGRGRGRIISNVNNKNVNFPINSPKNVICSAITFLSSPIFEYAVNFQPEIHTETARINFIKKHFSKLDKPFLYNKFSVFVPNLLQDKELNCKFSNRNIPGLFTMKLTFKQKLNLESYPNLLLNAFLQEAQKNSLIISELESKIICDYNITIRKSEIGMLLCLDYQNYYIQDKNIDEMIFELENRFPERFCRAADILLRKIPIFYKEDCKMYVIKKIYWETRLLELEQNGLQRTAKPEDCKVVEKITDLPQTANDFMSKLNKLFLLKNDWNLHFGNFTNAKARVLKPETIIFGDGVKYEPKNGNWEIKMRENEVLILTELWCWMILYTPNDDNLAQTFSNDILKLQDDTGISIGKPLLFEIENDTKTAYINALNNVICKDLQLIVIIIPESSKNKPESLLKHICCIIDPIPYKIINSSDLTDPLKIHDIVLQLNLLAGGIPWTVNIPYENWMICGVDLNFYNETLPPVCSFVTALTNDATQWYSKAVFVENSFLNCLEMWLEDTLKKFKDTNGCFPSQLLIYHNSTHRKFYEDYKKFNFDKLKKRNIKVCIILVEKNTNVYIYKDLKSGAIDFVPPGTVVDNTVTNPNACDFFLTSSFNCSTYYEVINDTSGLTSEQLELITYKMCHLFYKCAKTVEVTVFHLQILMNLFIIYKFIEFKRVSQFSTIPSIFFYMNYD